jgi:metal-responsive CopG/Arc/MetJ family transcriptional regulator
MKTIQMTLDEDLLNRVDKAIHELNTTRSAFIRESVQYYLERLKIKKLEKKHRDGYLKQPVATGEFDVWEYEQVWGN